MILLYTDSQLLDLEWIPLLKFPEEPVVTHDFIHYQNTAADLKIALTAHRLNCTYDADCTAYKGFEDKVRQLSDISDLVFTFESELHNFHWSIWHACHRPNVYWVQPGAVNDDEMNQHIIFWGDWFKTTSNLYKNLPDKLQSLIHYELKPKKFEALLGAFKPHRTFVAKAVEHFQLEEKFILTYGGRWDNNNFYAKDYFIWEPGCEPVDKIIGTADTVRYCGQLAHLSQIIPIDVYNNTIYSIVAETDADNTLSFYSEKTAKALISKRLFVAFTGFKFLKNLRAIGFQTFGDFIDESYDNIQHDGQRYQAAFDQVRYLCAQNNVAVIDTLYKARPVFEHNRNLIMNTDWTQYTVDRIQQQINKIL